MGLRGGAMTKIGLNEGSLIVKRKKHTAISQSRRCRCGPVGVALILQADFAKGCFRDLHKSQGCGRREGSVVKRMKERTASDAPSYARNV